MTLHLPMGWSGGVKVLGKLAVLGRSANLYYSRARPMTLVVGAG